MFLYPHTQGVALGWYAVPRWGNHHRLDMHFCLTGTHPMNDLIL